MSDKAAAFVHEFYGVSLRSCFRQSWDLFLVHCPNVEEEFFGSHRSTTYAYELLFIAHFFPSIEICGTRTHEVINVKSLKKF
jgi:hypothetical protein